MTILRLVEAVAVRDGKFLAVGASDYIQRMAGPETREIDLNGRSVVPGLYDTHLHQAWVGQVLKTGSWRLQLKDLDSGLEEFKAVVEKAPFRESGCSLALPNNKVLVNELRLEHLDPLSPDNPVVIVTGCNIGVANTLALKEVPPGNGRPGQRSRNREAQRIGLGICTGECWPMTSVPSRRSKKKISSYKSRSSGNSTTRV